MRKFIKYKQKLYNTLFLHFFIIIPAVVNSSSIGQRKEPQLTTLLSHAYARVLHAITQPQKVCTICCSFNYCSHCDIHIRSVSFFLCEWHLQWDVYQEKESLLSWTLLYVTYLRFWNISIHIYSMRLVLATLFVSFTVHLPTDNMNNSSVLAVRDCIQEW